jgi:hypothetical protein
MATAGGNGEDVNASFLSDNSAYLLGDDPDGKFN